MSARWLIPAIATTLLVLLAGCDPTGLVDKATPPVRAVNGGSAELMLQACPTPGNLASTEAAMQHLIITLETAGLVVNANGGTARLEIDLCSGAGE